MTAQWGADANVLGWQNGDIGGSGTGGASLGNIRSYLVATYLSDGLGPFGKFFDGGGGWHTAYTNYHASGYGDAANERHPVICAKSHDTSAFNTLMTDMAAALPSGELWYACFFSEPEDDFNAGTLTHSDYQAAWASMDTLRTAHAHGAQVKFIPILMAYQEISGTSHWSTFLTPVLSVADVIGWDVYDDNGDPQSWSFAADIYPAIQALQTTSGLPWAIPEYGLQVSTHSGSTDNAAGVLSRWEAMVATCEADPDFLWGNYWMDGPHATNQRSAVIRTDTANANYLTSLIAGAPGDPPANDNFADAEDLGTADTGSFAGTTADATFEAGEPVANVGSDSDTHTVWFKWTPAASGWVEFVAPDDPDGNLTVFDAWTGTDLTDLTQVASSYRRYDDTNGFAQRLDINGTASTTYWIRAYANVDVPGAFSGSWAPFDAPDPPANDNFADAETTDITSDGIIDGTTVGATTEPNEPAGPSPLPAAYCTVWYEISVTSNGTRSIAISAADVNAWFDVWTGSDLADLSAALDLEGAPCAGATNSSDNDTIHLIVGTTYWLRVGCGDAGGGTFELDITVEDGFTGYESFHSHGGSAYLGTHIGTITGTGWADNLRARSAVAIIDIGDTAIDGVTFTDDPALLEPDWRLPPPSLPNGPAARVIHKMWLDISGPPTLDDLHQPHAGSWPGTGGERARAIHGNWGHYRIKVGTKNVTTFRGAQTLITQLSHTDPFGDDTCSMTFPRIGPFEHRGVPGTDLHWLPGADDDRHIPITIHHVHPDGTITTQFEGDIDGIVDTYDGRTGGLVVNGTGLIKTLDDRITKPRFTSDPIDIGRLIHQWTAYEAKYGWHGHPCPARHTGIQTAERGGYGDPLMTTTIQNLLATAQTGDNTKWTIRNHRPRGMRLHIRDLTTVHFTLWCGQPGVTHQLTRDLSHATRAIFGEGQDHDIQFWRNTQYPNAQISAPDYPLPDGTVFTPGGSHTGFTPFSDELNSRRYHLDSNDTYLAADADNIRAFQRDAGISIDGAVGPQTWNAAFADATNANALDAYIRPLAVTPTAEPFRYNGRGGIIGRNPDYAHHTRREKLEQYGTMSKADARRSAHLEMPVIAHADYTGTVTLTSIDPPELCALSIRDGMNFTFQGHAGVDRLLHIAKVDIDPGMQAGSARTVTLTTSERGDDYITLAARMQRNRDVVDQSGRRHPPRRSSKRTPDFAPFDSESGAGFLTPKAQFAGLWNVYPIPGGELGGIVHVRLVASTPTLIAAAVFNRRVTARQLSALPGLADPSAGGAGGQDPWQVNAHKLTRNLKYRDQPRMAWATGGPGAMQGYFPHQPAAGATITGVLDDSSPWSYHSARPPWLWLAVWTRDSCRVGGDPDYDHRALFPGPPS